MDWIPCIHQYEIDSMEMSEKNPPKAWYKVSCRKCGEIKEGHAENVECYVDEVCSGNPRGVTTLKDVKRAYIQGRIDEIEFEQKLNELFGL